MSMRWKLLFGLLLAACAANQGSSGTSGGGGMPAPAPSGGGAAGSGAGATGGGGSGGAAGGPAQPDPGPGTAGSAGAAQAGGTAGAAGPEQPPSPDATPQGAAGGPGGSNDAGQVAKKKIIVFTHTTGYRHVSIERAATTLRTALSGEGFEPTATANPEVFTTAGLADVAAVILVSTTGKPLGDPGTEAIAALEAFVTGGGVLIGLHAASSTLYDPGLAYTRLIGGKFESHPGGVRAARCHGEGDHPAAAQVPAPFMVRDEIYVFSNYRSDNQVVLTCEAVGGGERLPIAWHRTEGQGRIFYTALGHSDEDWSMTAPYFAQHAWPGILWALER